MQRSPASCPDCESLDRRSFLKSTGVATVAGVAMPMLVGQSGLFAAPTAKSSAETAVGKFYASLSDEQKKTLCFSFDHELRKRISANWHVTKPKIGSDFFSKSQQGIIRDIVRGLTSEEGYERLVKQMDDDAGGLEEFSVAIFGEPGNGAFEWELTGRHLTLRADGNSVDKAAFGGPIIYGHGEETPKDNLYHYQTKQVNEVFKALDAKQAEKALVAKAPAEAAVALQGENGRFPGIAVSELSGDQKQLVTKTVQMLLAPYRQDDVDEVMEILKAAGGVEKLHMAFYQQGDLGGDQVWDIWRVEGPSFVWHFRGAPHVHAYINIGEVKT
jgi:anaerobic selenocysteine-containing dehydrogenase